MILDEYFECAFQLFFTGAQRRTLCLRFEPRNGRTTQIARLAGNKWRR